MSETTIIIAIIAAAALLLIAAGALAHRERTRQATRRAEDARAREHRAAEERRQRAEAAAAEARQQEEARLRQEERARREAEAARAYDGIAAAMDALESAGEYLAASTVGAWQTAHATALALAREGALLPYLSSDRVVRIERWRTQLAALPDTVRAINERFIARRLAEERAAFDRVERFPLTERQRRAIVTAEDATLVIAGAGTGKTSTIVGRVDYLTRRALARPEQILVLAYGKDAAAELQDRLQRLGAAEGAEISTFHALGRKIVGQVEGVMPTLSPMAEDKDFARKRFLRDGVAEALADPARRPLLVSFLTEYLDEELDGDSTKTSDELLRWERARGLRAIDNTKLRSRQEVRIANWLTLNGIAWEYERPYPIDTATPWRRQYLPDFYLPDHDLYLEHFGVDRDGNTAPHVNGWRYRQAMAWKRELHRTHGTRLVETYSWFASEGGLERHLERVLRSAGVAPQPLTAEQIARIVDEANKPVSDFISLLDQFLALFKGGGADRAATVAKAQTARDCTFLGIFWPLYERYETELTRSRKIDFDDMINRAREHVRSRAFHGGYTDIIVDEFQDISDNRLGLLRDLRAQTPCRLFVVGDDWQSIYRFAGSDVGIITHLAERVGPTARVDLDIAFRYPQELLDLSTRFVTANPAQLQKTLRAHQGASGRRPARLLLTEPGAADDAAPTALETIAAEIAREAAGSAASILVLGRYRHDQPNELEKIRRALKPRGITIDYLTAHRSKGREADYVVVIELKAGNYGFPSGVADDAVMRMVLTAGETFPAAEERRLFYVALTRARRRVYLIAPHDEPSPFVRDDVLSEALRPFVDTVGAPSPRLLCPRCGGRTIRRRDGKHGPFWACANWPACTGTLDLCPVCASGALARGTTEDGLPVWRCSECGAAQPTCPRCGEGYLVVRNGKYGEFQGCSHWDGGEGCRFTRDAIPVG
ncbi:MAG: UvrD-helicase domain-containing protein [Thermomicrobiales bacterium]|nr:UvrD-helicase domain-containing protein [Thermomicrobiales bacterium]